MQHYQHVFGEYVLQPCPNAFNNSTSYWISKKGYIVSVYCFTPFDQKDLDYHIEHIDNYKNLLEQFLKRR